MKRFIPSLLLFLVMIFILLIPICSAQEKQSYIEELKKEAPKIYIDCSLCDKDYIRTEITFVNYVRDRKEAQIHVLITTLSTGSGGREYTIAFIGQHEFEGINDTHKYFSQQTDTKDEIREGLTKAIKLGLMSYVAKTPIAKRVNISYKKKEKQGIVKDKWNYWVFRMSSSGSFHGEKTYKSQSLVGSFSASRITPEWKIRTSLSGSYLSSDYSYNGETLKSTRESMSFDGLFVKSLNDHWSIGASIRIDSSTYDNVKLAVSSSPAIEFNLFPYSESTRRQLRFLYKVGYENVNYLETTIYDKNSESLWSESLSISFDIKEKWGNG